MPSTISPACSNPSLHRAAPSLLNGRALARLDVDEAGLDSLENELDK
jgi:hypothetical protein